MVQCYTMLLSFIHEYSFLSLAIISIYSLMRQSMYILYNTLYNITLYIYICIQISDIYIYIYLYIYIYIYIVFSNKP